MVTRLGWVCSDEFSLRYSDLVTGGYDCVDRIVLNAFFPLGHNPGGFRVWWRRWHGDSDAELDNTHLMRMAGRFARRVKAWGAANGVPVIFCKAGRTQAPHRRGVPGHSRGRHRGVLGAGGQGAGAGVEGEALAEDGPRSSTSRGEANTSTTIRFTSSTRLGARHDQDVGASAVRRADHPQRPRVRGPPGRDGGDSIQQGRQLLHRGRRPRGPGSDRRCLVAACGCRAAEPGLQIAGSIRRACASGSTSTSSNAAGSATRSLSISSSTAAT